MPTYGNFSVYDDEYPWKMSNYDGYNDGEGEGDEVYATPNKFGNFSVYGFVPGMKTYARSCFSLKG